jgi:hypothetical protein
MRNCPAVCMDSRIAEDFGCATLANGGGGFEDAIASGYVDSDVLNVIVFDLIGAPCHTFVYVRMRFVLDPLQVNSFWCAHAFSLRARSSAT